ncbi:MAG: hypothetical protein JKY49_17215 [Cohaesibacteraceae bacterium]|nr:hypothetical protein [Cohaesibacteraceae bacterium]
MLLNIPLLLAPFAVYNLFAMRIVGPAGGDPWVTPIFTVNMVSDARWTMTLGDMMITAGLVLLFVEVLKATRSNMGSIFDHLLSTLLFIVFLIEFLLVAEAATSVFFILMIISLIDVIAGFSITIRTARRDMTIGHTG